MRIEINDNKAKTVAIYRSCNGNSHNIELELDFEQLWMKDTEEEIATTFLESVRNEIKCPECNGDGYLWEAIDCAKSANYCCGGCGRNEECEECKGYGRVSLCDDIDFL